MVIKSLEQYMLVREQGRKIIEELTNIAEQLNLKIRAEELVAKHAVFPVDQASQSVDSYSMGETIEGFLSPMIKPFRVGVVGEFSRGKTTLINALLGRDILTSDSRPNTAALTTIYNGKEERIVVNFLDKAEHKSLKFTSDNIKADIATYVSDSAVAIDEYVLKMAHKEQSLAEQIENVRVWIDSPFLRDNEVSIIDTPGLGSIFESHQSISTQAIPTFDIILFVIQCDVPISESELNFLKSVNRYADRFVFVITKADKALNIDDLESVVDFNRTVIESNLDITNADFLVTSARPVNIRKQFLPDNGVEKLWELIAAKIATTHGRERLKLLGQTCASLCLWILDSIQVNTLQLNYKIKFLRTRYEWTSKRLEIIYKTKSIISQSQNKLLSSSVNVIINNIDKLLASIAQTIYWKLHEFSANDFSNVNDKLQPCIQNIISDWLKYSDHHFSEVSYKSIQVAEQILLTYVDIDNISIEKHVEGIDSIVIPPLAIDQNEISKMTGMIFLASIFQYTKPIRNEVLSHLGIQSDTEFTSESLFTTTAVLTTTICERYKTMQRVIIQKTSQAISHALTEEISSLSKSRSSLHSNLEAATDRLNTCYRMKVFVESKYSYAQSLL